jgi:hypothetical protein
MGKNMKLPVEFETLDLLDAAKMMINPRLGRARVKMEVVASRMGMPVGTLSNKINGHMPLLARDVAPLTMGTGDHLLIQLLCMQCGGTFHLNASEGATPGELVQELQHELLEHAHVHGAILKAMEDGQITEDEMEAIDREMAEHASEITHLRAALGRMRKERK